MKQKRSWLIALILGLLVIGSAGIIAAQSALFDNEEASSLYDNAMQSEEMYEQAESDYEALEHDLEQLYTSYGTAMESNSDPEILRLAKAIYTKENELEELAEELGLEAELEGCEAEDMEGYPETNNPEAQSIIGQIEALDSRIEAIEEGNEGKFAALADQESQLWDQFEAADDKDDEAAMSKIEAQLDALDEKYKALEDSLGITNLAEQIETLEKQLDSFGEE